MLHRLTRRRAAAALLALAAGRVSSLHAQDIGDAPWPTQDWETSTTAAQDMAPNLPEAIDAALAELPTVTGVVVVRNGFLVSEHYPGAYAPDEPVNVRSITKSVVASLVGIALRRRELLSLAQTVGDLIPDRIPRDADPAVADVTVRHLLTMTSGLSWSADADYDRLTASDDYVELTLSLPVVDPSGEVYVYNSGGSHLLAVMLEAATGEEIETYADRHLFDPLGIKEGRWWQSPQGEAIGGFGLHLTPRDMAKIGYLYLRDGAWDGKRLIPRGYLEQAIRVQSAGDSTGGTPYGFQWWVTEATGYNAFFALGYGSQYIYVVPALDLVVAIATGYDDDDEPPRFSRNRPLIEELIIPSTEE